MALARGQVDVVRMAGIISLLRSPEQKYLPLYGAISWQAGLREGLESLESAETP